MSSGRTIFILGNFPLPQVKKKANQRVDIVRCNQPIKFINILCHTKTIHLLDWPNENYLICILCSSILKILYQKLIMTYSSVFVFHVNAYGKSLLVKFYTHFNLVCVISCLSFVTICKVISLEVRNITFTNMRSVYLSISIPNIIYK